MSKAKSKSEPKSYLCEWCGGALTNIQGVGNPNDPEIAKMAVGYCPNCRATLWGKEKEETT